MHAKEARSGSGGREPLILKQDIDGGQGSASRRVFVEQEADPRIGPDVFRERKFSLASIGNRNTNPQA